jgi:hypothetical protein
MSVWLQQEAKVRELVPIALDLLNGTLFFDSVHAAALKPHRLARWLERAVGLLPEKQCAWLALMASYLVSPQRPAGGECTPGEAPGKVTAEQWKERAVKLQREVSH